MREFPHSIDSVYHDSLDTVYAVREPARSSVVRQPSADTRHGDEEPTGEDCRKPASGINASKRQDGRFRHILIGQARTSTADQNPDHQFDALQRAGVEEKNIHVETAGGAKTSRPKLGLVLQHVRQGDTLKVTRLDRLPLSEGDRGRDASVVPRTGAIPSRAGMACTSQPRR
ncbi:recombinase family protein [Streptomyces sp. NPDC002306]